MADDGIEALKSEISELKAAIAETNLGAASLGICIAQALSGADPSMPQRLEVVLRIWLEMLEGRPRSEARQILLTFARAIVDPAFPLSSYPADFRPAD